MRLFHFLQERFGFTRNETTVLLFLSVTLLAGSGLRWYRHVHGTAQDPLSSFDYAVADSQFAALARASPPDSAPAAPLGDPRSRAAPRDTLRPASIDLNRADADALMRLPGVGPATAREIIRHRTANGSFRSVDELLEVKGIGPKKLEKIRPFVTIR